MFAKLLHNKVTVPQFFISIIFFQSYVEVKVQVTMAITVMRKSLKQLKSDGSFLTFKRDIEDELEVI